MEKIVNRGNLLIVDDEKNIREGLCELLKIEGYSVYSASNGKEALSILNSEDIDLVVTDLKMPIMSGEELLKVLANSFPTLPVIVLTGHGTVENAVAAMRNGAYDFLTKPLNLDRLTLLVKRAMEQKKLLNRHKELEAELETLSLKNSYKKMIGKSSQMKKIMEVIEQVANTKASVLITGESGVGKELVAEALHYLSDRRKEKIVKVNCSALTETLLESELFGHEEGAFTGAITTKKGRFELANRGTIFLDEIGEINQATQVKILRVLQEKQFERVGGTKTIDVDIRIISATNRNLQDEIDKGTFREDLFYRLNVVNIHVPPLRERSEDIPLLATSFLNEISKENNKKIEGFDKKAMSALIKYKWPGNIRELRNCIENSVVLCKKSMIYLDDLPDQIVRNQQEGFIRINLGTTLAEAEKEIILQTLGEQAGNKSRTADVLGIGRKTLQRKLQEYGE